MLAYCNFYHGEIRLLGQVDGEDRIERRLCPECRERMSDEVDAYVEQLRDYFHPAPVAAVSGR